MNAQKRDRIKEAREKLARIPVKVEANLSPLPKPDWMRIRLPIPKEGTPNPVTTLTKKLRSHALVTVCEEATCPNLHECFSSGTATFMIMGELCTRRCSFCDVAHGRPKPLDPKEPDNLAKTVYDMSLKYVVITSVDRDDLKDGGASHFRDCIRAIRLNNPGIQVEILVPDFRGRKALALNKLAEAPPDVFNHNIETVPRLYLQARPGSDYHFSLELLQDFYQRFPSIPTKSGMMLGLGETLDEIKQVMQDLRNHQVSNLTLGQYLQPTRHHFPVKRYVHPDEFNHLAKLAKKMGFKRVASGPLVRSSYHADKQASGDPIC